METVQITKEKLNKFAAGGKFYISKNMAKKSVLWINVDSLLELATKKLKKVEREKELVRMKYCKKTASKHIEYSKTNQYQFTEDDNVKVLDEFDRIDAELVDFPQMIVTKGEYPEKGMTYDIRDAFKGIVIAENEYDVNNPELKALLEAENERVEAEEEELEETE